MKTRKISAYGLIAVILALTLTTCDTGGGSKDPAHTHEWEGKVTTPATPTADGLETETCKTCGATNGTRPIAKLVDDTDDPKNQTATRTLAHGVGTVTVQGYMTNAQWNGVADRVRDSINSGLEAHITSWGEQVAVDAYKELFDRGVIWDIEQNPVGYHTYKTTASGTVVYVALDKLDTVIPGDVFLGLYQKRTVVDGITVI
jgi:hypothetical protein